MMHAHDLSKIVKNLDKKRGPETPTCLIDRPVSAPLIYYYF
jgi:hypothetical protein